MPKVSLGLFTEKNARFVRNVRSGLVKNGKESKDNDPGEPGKETDKYIHRVCRNRLWRRTWFRGNHFQFR